jgi:hypothetical protein
LHFAKKRKFEEPIPDSIEPVDLLKPSARLMKEKKEKFAKRGIDLSKSRFQELNPPKLNLPKLPKPSKNASQGASKMSQRFAEASNETSQTQELTKKQRKKEKKREKNREEMEKLKNGSIKIYSDPLGKDLESQKKVLRQLNAGNNLWFICPISNKKIVTPVRGENCQHGSTFCYQHYKRMEHNRDKCPYCPKKIG